MEVTASLSKSVFFQRHRCIQGEWMKWGAVFVLDAQLEKERPNSSRGLMVQSCFDAQTWPVNDEIYIKSAAGGFAAPIVDRKRRQCPSSCGSSPVFVERNQQHHCFLLQYAAVQMCSSLNSVVSYLALGSHGERMRLTRVRLLSWIDQ